MSWHCEEVQEKSLKPAADKNAYNLHLAALDWSLVEPIIINKAEDIKASNWRERGLTPYTHQIQNLITFCRRLPVGLIADDVGLGKTISAGLIVSELISRRKVSRILIVCPKVLTSQWVSELEEKFGLFGREYTGRDLGAAFNSKTQIVVTTYHSVSNRLEKIQDSMFDMIILDEAHKLRNLYGGNSVPAIALNIRNAFQRRPFKYVLMLTATPIQNKIWDLYSLIDILKVAEGKANPLGNPTDFAETYLKPGTSGRILIKGMARQFQNMVRDCISRTRRGDISLHFPRRIIELFRVPLTREESKMIRVVGQHIDQLSPLLQTSLAQAMMSSPRALVEQVRNMVRNGTLFPFVLTEIEELASNVKVPAKLEYLINWIETLIEANPSTWRVVVFTVRLETQSMLFQEFKNKGFKVGLIKGGDHQANQKTIESYKTNPPTINLIVSSDAGAEGINLQAGNTLINYDLPWNPMVVEQRIGRVQRLGSAFESVSIGNMVGQGTIEDRIVGRLTEKLQGISQAVGDIEGILEAANLDDEDGDLSYEGRIRNLVVNALKGADVTGIQTRMEKDIEVAKVIYENEKANLDVNLGDSGTDHSAVKAMPRIETKPPQMPFRDFVLSAMASNGYRLAHKSEALVEASKPGMPLERISFSENDLEHGNAVFGGTNIKQYIPGKPHFERLVQHWVDHHGHHVIDTSRSVRTLANDLASEWVACFPKMKFLEAEFKPENESFFGNYYLRVRAATGVDSYEKIIFGQINPDLEIPVDQSVAFPVLTKETKLSELAPSFQDLAQAQANSDKDIGRFCDFYLNRLQEGLQQAGNDAVNERKLASDFRPIVHAEVVGLEGYQYQKGIVKIRVEIDSFQYAINIPAIPSSKNLLEQPSVSECNVTGFHVPIAFLEKCASTGVFALRHKMEKYGDNGFVVQGQLVTCSYLRKPILRSDAVEDSDGIFTHKSYMVVCEHTGKTIWMVKATKSYSGRWGSNDIIFSCPISPLKCLPDETVVCKATGRQVCQANAVQSIVTGDWYGNDQLNRSDISGKLAPPPDMVVCQATNSKIILSESVICNVCNKQVRKDYLVTSAASGRQFCRSHAKEVAGGRIALPEEVGSCAISGKTLLLGELTICQDTGETISKQLAGVCSLSGKTLRQSLLVNCAATGVSLARNLATELAGGRFSVPSACGKCAMTGKFYLLNELVKCELTGDSVAIGCLGKCSITQAKVRRDRLVPFGPSTSSTQIISNPILFYCPALTVKDHHGKIIPLKDSRKCAVSEIISHISETKACQHTGVQIHESMAERCQVSNKIVRKDILLKSTLSGILMLPEFAVQLTDGGFVLIDESAICNVCDKRIRKDHLVTSAASGRQFCKSHAMEVAGGRIALPEEIGSCAISGKTLLLGELTICYDTGETISKQLAGVCGLSGKTLRQSLLVNCAATGVCFARKLATELAKGRFSLPSACGKCSMTGEFYLLAELDKCELTGDSVVKQSLGKCSITGANVRRDRLVSIATSLSSAQNGTDSNQLYCPALTVKDHHGKMIPLKESRKCAVSKKISHISETKACQHTGVQMHESMAATCQISNKVVRKDILLKSSVSGILMLREFAVQLTDGGFGTAEETGLCHWSGKIVNRLRLKKCKVTGIPVCKDFLNEDQQLEIVREMLDGKNIGSVVDADKLSRLRANPQIGSWIKGKVTENPAIATDTYVVSALHSGLLGINVKVYLAVMRSDPDGEKVLGKISTIDRRGGLWWILDT